MEVFCESCTLRGGGVEAGIAFVVIVAVHMGLLMLEEEVDVDGVRLIAVAACIEHCRWRVCKIGDGWK